MSYTAFDGTKPTTAQTRQAAITSILQNLLAVRDMTILGDAPGFDFSVSGGTAAQPAIMYRKLGTEWIRASITWGSSGGSDGNPTVIVYSYSPDSGSNWNTIKTVTYAYDSDGNVTSSTWS